MHYQEELMDCLLTINRVRASKAGSGITPEFLARDMGRWDAREFCEASMAREPGMSIKIAPNPYREPRLRQEWDKGFWEAVSEIRGE
jgi:hypothetical protein